jgi:VWFA-related protein
MMFFMRALLILVFAAAAVAAQDRPPLYRSTASEVRLDVQVVENGRPVTTLNKGDFLVWDEGQAQPVDFFARESVPLQLLLVLDTSGSMTKILAEMASAGQQALSALKPEDQVAVMVFAGRARLILELTADRNAAARQLHDAGMDQEDGAGTAINAAVIEAAQYLQQTGSPQARHAILILTDNGSLSYRITDDDVLRALSGANAVLNAIVPPSAKPPKETSGGNPDFTPHNVFKLAALSGGETLKADRAAERFREMLERIRSRYALGYKAPQAAPGAFRRLRVDLSPDARRRSPKAQVLVRAGYFALSDSRGVKTVFDGRSLDGWLTSPLPVAPEPGWSVEGGTLRTTPGKGLQDYLVSVGRYRDFDLQFEWKVEPGANSGIKYRVQGWVHPETPQHDVRPFYEGASKFEPIAAEYQIADDEKNPDALSDVKHSAGALYEFAAPRKSRPAGANVWHTGRIVVKGLHFEHWLDGEKVVEGDFQSDEMRASYGISKRRGTAGMLSAHTELESPIILQFHNGVVWFRNIRIRPL